jgi:hypothetical protein
MILQYLWDYLHAATAFLLFIPLFVFPGYVLGETTGIFRFRSHGFLTRTCFSLGFSVAIAPIILFFLWAASIQWAIAGYFLSAAIGIGLMLKNRQRILQIKIPKAITFIGAAWTLIVLFSLVDLPVGSGLYINSVANPDLSYRVEVVAQLARTVKLPPLSPFSAGISAMVVLRYHYFWLMLCGIIPKITDWRIGARDALVASVIWIGFLLLAVVGLYWKLFFNVRDALRKSIASIPVLFLGGLQGPMFLAMIFLYRWRRNVWQLPRPTLTWLELKGQITNWLDSLLWVPHCVAAVLASLCALLALHEMHKVSDWRKRLILMLVASLSLASTIGLSIFICVPFFMYLGILCIHQLFKAPGRRLWIELASALLLAILLIAPYLLSIREPAGSPFPLAFCIRPSDFATHLAKHIPSITPLGRQLLNLATEPLVFFYELGMMAVIAIWAATRGNVKLSEEKRNQNRLIGLFVLITALTALFINSENASGRAGGTNDIGWRTPLGALFFLTFYAVWFFEGWRKNRLSAIFPSWGHKLRLPLMLLIVLGFGTTFTEFMLLRFYFVVHNTHEVGTHTEDLRTGLDFLRHHSAPEAVVQLNPGKGNALYSGFFMERGTALREADTASHFINNAASPNLRLQVENEIKPIFENPELQFDQVQQRCSTLGINYLVFQPDDAVFANNRSWIWRFAPFYANQSVRVYRCGAVHFAG